MQSFELWSYISTRESSVGLRFRKSIGIIPGVRLNIGLKRTSLSIGGRGLTYNIGSKGSRVTVGIPGSGLSYSTSVSQTPNGLLPSGRRFSATPFVIAAFVLGLLYIAFHSANTASVASLEASKSPSLRDTTGSIPQIVQDSSPLDGPVPLPRPRQKVRSDSVGAPLQLVPQQ